MRESAAFFRFRVEESVAQQNKRCAHRLEATGFSDVLLACDRPPLEQSLPRVTMPAVEVVRRGTQKIWAADFAICRRHVL